MNHTVTKCAVHFLLCVCVCVCFRAVPGGQDPQRWCCSRSNPGIRLEQKFRQAQRFSSWRAHTWWSVIVRKQVELHSQEILTCMQNTLWIMTLILSLCNQIFHDIYLNMFYRPCDVIIEVCHPQIVREFGVHFLSQSHFMVRLYFFLSLLRRCGYWFIISFVVDLAHL